jgi:hypothetical protein
VTAPCTPRGQCGAVGPRDTRTWPLTCVVPTGFEPVSPPNIPHDIENRGVATGIDQELNPQVSGRFPPPPQVTESARRALSSGITGASEATTTLLSVFNDLRQLADRRVA